MNGHIRMVRVVFHVGHEVVQRIPPLLPRSGPVGSKKSQIHRMLLVPNVASATKATLSVTESS